MTAPRNPHPYRVHTFGDDALGTDDATGLAERLRRREVSPAELLEAALARVVAVDPELGALAHLDAERARRRAAHPLGDAPLAGVPTAFKDNLAVAGAPMTQGSDALTPTPLAVDGPVAELFLRTGLVPVGTTAMPPFGWTAATERQGGRYTRNPRLEGLGHAVEPVDPPVGPEFGDDFVFYWSLLALGVWARGPWLFPQGFDRSRLDPFTLGLARRCARNLWRSPLHAARLARAVRGYDDGLGHVDVVLSPVVAHVTPPAGYLDADLDLDVHLRRVWEWVSFTPLRNVAGAPAVSLPTATDDDGLPLGVMLAARRGADRLLLELTAEYEAAHPWRRIDRA